MELSLDLDNSLSLRPRRKRRIDGLSPDLEDSLLKSAGRKALGGVAAVGGLLDVPGSMVRDTLAGENPFDQLASPFDPEKNRTSGRELLRDYGMVGRRDTWGNWGAGFAAEVALDPTTYLTLGGSALTKSGKVAQAIGALPDAARAAGAGKRVARMTTSLGSLLDYGDDALKATRRTAAEAAATKAGSRLSDLLDEPLGTLARLEIPFTDIGVNVGGGKAAQYAAGLLDKAGMGLAKSAPGRAINALLDPAVNGKLQWQEQEVAREAYRLKDIAKRNARWQHVAAMDEMEAGWKQFAAEAGINPAPSEAATIARTAFDKIVRHAAETNGDVDDAFRNIMDNVSPTPELAEKIRGIGRTMQKANDSIHSEIAGKGGRVAWLAERESDGGLEGFKHLPRYVTIEKNWDALKPPRNLQTMHSGMAKRSEPIRHVPADIINKMLVDEALRTDTAASVIQQKYGQYLDPKYGEELDSAGQVLTPGSADNHAAAIAEWVGEHRSAEMFSRTVGEDFFKYQLGAQTANKMLDAVHEVVRRNLDDVGEVNLKKAFKNALMDPDQAVGHLAKLTGIDAAKLSTMGVPMDVANAIVGANRVHSQPEWAKLIGESVDKYNSWFKQAVTLPFPSFWTRNFASGQYANLALGQMSSAQDVADYTKQVFSLTEYAKNGIPQEKVREWIIEGVIDERFLSEGVEAAGFAWTPQGPSNPLNVRQTMGEAAKKMLESPTFTDKLPGGETARKLYNVALGTGEKATALVELANRVPLYEFLKAKGWTPEAAAAKVRELHVDYDALSPFEKNVARRVVPFYTWSRRLAPVIFQTLLERPGGALAQTIRASNDARDTNALTPDYVASTFSIPTGEKADGSQGYLTSFGLPYEQPLQYFDETSRGGLGLLQGMLREGFSQTTPLLKAPAELASGQSFFQRGPGGAGRPLEDLDPTLGRTLANIVGQERPVPTPRWVEQLLANSPLSRISTTARQLTEPSARRSPAEKALNVLTGVRTTNISPRAQDAVFRERLNDMLRDTGGRSFETVYLPDYASEDMTPQERQSAEELLLMQAVLADRAKKRKQAK